MQHAIFPFHKTTFLCLAILLAGFTSLSGRQEAYAHRQKILHTNIALHAKPNLWEIEITHRFHLHDGASALSVISNGQDTDVTQLTSQAKLAIYSAKHFSLSSQSQDTPHSPFVPIVLELIGVEIQGSYIYIFQQTRLPSPSQKQKWQIKNSILQDIFPTQINHFKLTQVDAETHNSLSFSPHTMNFLASKDNTARFIDITSHLAPNAQSAKP